MEKFMETIHEKIANMFNFATYDIQIVDGKIVVVFNDHDFQLQSECINPINMYEFFVLEKIEVDIFGEKVTLKEGVHYSLIEENECDTKGIFINFVKAENAENMPTIYTFAFNKEKYIELTMENVLFEIEEIAEKHGYKIEKHPKLEFTGD